MSQPRPLATPIDTLAQKLIGKDWPLYAHLLDHWRDIVGPAFAQTTTPVKIAFPKGKTKLLGPRADGVLHIRLPQGAQMEFSFMIPVVKQRIADSFGYPAIDKIVFEPYYPAPTPEKEPPEPLPLPQKEALENSLKDIENNELRDSLLKLGESVIHQSLQDRKKRG